VANPQQTYTFLFIGLMMDIFKEVQTAYDQMVFEYAKRNHSNMADNLVVLAQELIQYIGQNGHILEVGCGTGRDMSWFEAQKSIITGIDLSMGMLMYARKEVHGSLASMNMRHLGFCTGYFDGAWCCASLLHLPKTEAIYTLQEIRRVLKLEGMLVLSVQKGNGEGWEDSYVPEVKRFFARYQPDEMRNILLNNGFSIRKASSSQEGNREWLSFVCIAK
jgi:ubiquinone/menaquinone biosynthesis C-methylase UbiE